MKVGQLKMGDLSLPKTKDIFNKPLALVAGGAGFVGSYLCELLLLKDCRVVAVDSLQANDKENLNDCFGHPHFNFIKHNLAKPLDQIDRLDYLFDLNGLELDDVEENISSQILKTTHLLKLALKTQARYLLGSSFRIVNAEIDDQQLVKNLTADAVGKKLKNMTEAKRLAENLAIRHFQEFGLDVRIVRLADIYGPRMNLSAHRRLALLFKAAVAGRTLKIQGDGSFEVYPTFVSDLIYGLSKVMFSTGLSGRVLTLINPQPISLLTMAKEIQQEIFLNNKIQGGFKIELVSQNRAKAVTAAKVPTQVLDQIKKDQVDLGWEARVSLSEGINQTLSFFPTKIKKTKTKGLINKSKLKKHRPFRFFKNGAPFLVLSFLLLGLLFYPLAAFGFETWQGVNSLKTAKRLFEEADFVNVVNKARLAQESFFQARQKVQFIFPALTFLNLKTQADQLDKRLYFGEALGQSAAHAGKAAILAAQVGEIIFENQEGDVQLLLDNIDIELDFIYDRLSMVDAELKERPDLSPMDLSLSEARQLILDAKKGLTVLPWAIGLEGERVYLVLLQNNMELRPTGGFIGSFALSTFKKGKLTDFEVMDVYSADGQLKGHVEPPEPIKKYLGEAGWFLRDSNWHPDFPISAMRAEWFLEKEIDRTVDGVVGVNLFFAQNILKEIGGVTLLDFNEEINHQNLFEKAEYYIQTNFFPGSTRKKDFLASMARTLFAKIKTGEMSTQLAFAKAVYQSLSTKDLQIYFHSPQVMAVISDLGWDGRIKDLACRPSAVACFIDYLMVVEANLGVNKANYFTDREMVHQVKIFPDGTVKKVLQIDYFNRSQSENFPAGRYKNYLRLLLPRLVKLESVTIDGRQLAQEKIDETAVLDKKSYGFLVEVPIMGKKAVEIHYSLANKINLAEPTQYLLMLQKQSGIRDRAFHFWLTAPAGVSLVDVKPKDQGGINLAKSGEKDFRTFLASPDFNQDIVFEATLVR